MREFLSELAGPQYVDAILWTLGALLLLVVVLAVIKVVSGMNGGTFVAGGRARKTRLAVMDATAIDSQRRLVLVRRDDVEHLLLIGGPTDVVVEQDIRVMGQRRPTPRPSVSEYDEQPAPRPEPPARPQELSPPPAARPAPAAARAYPPEPRRAPEPVARPAAERPAPAAARPTPVAQPAPAAQRPTPPTYPARVDIRAPRPESRPQRDSIDDALMNELDLTTDETPAAPGAKGKDAPSLDDEMAKLFGELANPKR